MRKLLPAVFTFLLLAACSTGQTPAPTSVRTNSPVVQPTLAAAIVPTAVLEPADETATAHPLSAVSVPSPMAIATQSSTPAATITSLATESPLPPSPAFTSMPIPPSPTPACATNANANLRGGPGTVYPIAGSLVAGQVLEVVAKESAGQWYQLRDGRWIFAQLTSNCPTVRVANVIPTPPLPPATWTPTLPTPRPVVWTPTFAPQPPAPPGRVCCKICSAGKACGNSCISRSYTCHVGPGCACDG
jgi:hypothetical protein